MEKKVIVKRVRKYVSTRIPKDVWEDAVKVKTKLDKTASELLGKPVSIPLTRVFRIKMRTPTTLSDDLIVKIARGKHEY